MLKVYGRSNSINVQKVTWTVAELGLAHERIDADGDVGSIDSPEYRKLNPTGRIPTIDDDGAVIWQSNTIIRYLTAKHAAGTLWPNDATDRAHGETWMDWQAYELWPPMRTIFWTLIRTPPDERDMDAVAAAVKEVGPMWAMFDAHLSERTYTVGDSFTMGDIPLGCACYRYLNLDIERPSLPHLEAWYGRLKEREAFRNHVMLPIT